MAILVIREHGTTLRKKQQRILVTYANPENPPLEKAATEIEQIIIEGNTSITTGAFELTAEYGIPIVIFTKGEFRGVYHPWTTHGSVAVRRAQMEAYNDHRAINYINTLLNASFTNKQAILTKILTRRQLTEQQKHTIQQSINNIEKAKQKLPLTGEHINKLRGTFFAIEAEATKEYFKSLQAIIPPEWGFNGRNRRPPKDPVNSMLSYAYMMLYYKTLNSLIISGLEPYAGFLHTDRAGKPSLAMDHMEEFRQPLVDRVILRIIGRKQLKPEEFTITQTGCIMNDKAKKTLIDEIKKEFEQHVNTPNGQIIAEHIILTQARKLGKYLRNQTRTYHPFIIKR